MARAQVRGFPNIHGKIKVRLKKYKTVVEPAIVKAAEFLLEKTLEITPVDTQRLRKSGRVKLKESGEISVFGSEVTAAVVFGNAEVDYSVFVHEDLSKYHEPPTTAKFLYISRIMWWKSMQRIIRQETERGL